MDELNIGEEQITVSVIVPAYNCEQYIEECLTSILNQDLQGVRTPHGVHIEISIYEDASTDSTYSVIQQWLNQHGAVQIIDNGGECATGASYNCYVIPMTASCKSKSTGHGTKFTVKLGRNPGPKPKGVGFARNRSIDQSTSTSKFLCFCDADDIMMPTRIAEQLKCAETNPTALIGSHFTRLPLNSMEVMTTWANTLTPAQLNTQVYSSFGPTIVMPTWFCSRQVYERVGGFHEGGYGVAEDLIFFYKHLNTGGTVIRADTADPLMIYRHHAAATTFSVSTDTIWNLRLDRLQLQVLSKWDTFTIWNAGKLGRKLFRSLSPANQEKVVSFCDVDPKKIAQKTYNPYPIDRRIPIVHFRDASPPFIICVKTELTFRDASTNNSKEPKDEKVPMPMSSTSSTTFLENLESLNLTEGVDYFYFN